MPVACCSPSEPVERLVNTDGASFHKLQLDLANEHRVKEVTFALKPDALHRNHLGTEGPHQPASSLCKKLHFFSFPPFTWCMLSATTSFQNIHVFFSS